MKILLAEMMSRRGFNQRELSERSGVPQPIISNIITGSTPAPRCDTLYALAKALRCAMEDLIEERENPSHDRTA